MLQLVIHVFWWVDGSEPPHLPFWLKMGGSHFICPPDPIPTIAITLMSHPDRQVRLERTTSRSAWDIAHNQAGV